MTRIGVLALQGSIIEHMDKLKTFRDVKAVAVKTKDDLKRVDGIILPGGESTTLGKLLRDFELYDPLRQRIENGLPVWGTCAGMILLAKEIVGEESHLSVMDIKVRRNGYGRQIDSFRVDALIPEINKQPIELVFIRAPWIEEVKGQVQVLYTLDGRIIAVQQDYMLATSFHPELTDDLSVHRYFLNLVDVAMQRSRNRL